MDDTTYCLDDYNGECEGEIEMRPGLSPTGKWFPRCDKHWMERIERQEEIDRRYPDTDHAPRDFDPYYAGEHWGSDY